MNETMIITRVENGWIIKIDERVEYVAMSPADVTERVLHWAQDQAEEAANFPRQS